MFFGARNENYISFPYCFSELASELPTIITDYGNIKMPKMPTISGSGNAKNEKSKSFSMNGTLDKGFDLVEKLKTSNTFKIYAETANEKDGKIEIQVTVMIGKEKYSGIVAYAGLSEIRTNGKIDKKKIDKIANDSINILRGTDNEKQNLTE
ncbi:MAG: hypothetical protein MJ179_10785 [Treponema sp.]|nr:hypothetical protein [Treponema sp.]MCQ2590898.1 hypothetical protein [Treponema sp.]